MRLWTLHAKYLDPQGLVALWREALLARAVLRGETRGYKAHPQLERLRTQRSLVDAYLRAIHDEASARGYAFDPTKFRRVVAPAPISVTAGQIEYEWEHLMRKLWARNRALHRQWRSTASPESHPLFRVRRGGIEPWE